MMTHIKATIIPRGRALGMVMNLPERDKHGYSIKYLKARLAVCFMHTSYYRINIGGGAGSDINQATRNFLNINEMLHYYYIKITQTFIEIICSKN